LVISFSDLLVGATALSLGYPVLTANMPHFRQLPGLSVVLFRQQPSVTTRLHLTSLSSFLADEYSPSGAQADRGRPITPDSVG
jgi:hypothetical protein